MKTKLQFYNTGLQSVLGTGVFLLTLSVCVVVFAQDRSISPVSIPDSPARFHGQFPVRTFHMQTDRGRLRIIDICEDSRGVIYACDSDGGISRYAGERWELLEASGILYIAYDGHGHVVCASNRELFFIECDGAQHCRARSLTAELASVGVDTFKFTNLSTVNGSVFATTDDQILRLQFVDGKPQFQVWNQDQIPAGMIVHGIADVNGQAMVHLSDTTFRLGTITLDDKIELIQIPNHPYGTVQQILPPSSNDDRCLLVTKRKLFEIPKSKAGPVVEVAVTGSLDNCQFRQGVWTSHNLLAVLTQYNGILFFDRKGTLQRHQALEGPGGRLLADRLGRIWILRDERIHRVDAFPNTLKGKLPDESVVQSFLTVDDTTYVAGKGLFRARIDPETGFPLEKLQRSHPFISYDLAEVDGEVFVATGQGIKSIRQSDGSENLLDIGPDHGCLQLLAPNGTGDLYCFYGPRNNPTLRHLTRSGRQWKVAREFNPDSFRKSAIFDPKTNSIWWAGSFDEGLDTHRLDLDSFHYSQFDVRTVPFLGGGEVCLAMVGRQPAQMDSPDSLFMKYDSSLGKLVDHEELNSTVWSGHWKWRYGDVKRVIPINQHEFIAVTNKSPMLRFRNHGSRENSEADWTISQGHELHLDGGTISTVYRTPSGGLLASSGSQIFFQSDLSAFNRKSDAANHQVLITSLSLTQGSTTILVNEINPPTSENSDGKKRYEVPYSSGTLRCEFAVPSLGGSEDVFYQTRLLGREDRWSQPTRKSAWESAALYEGVYELRVRALLPNGEATPEASVDLVVIAPWHRTWRLYLPIALTLLTSLVAFYMWRMRLQRLHVAELEHEIIERKLAEEHLREAQTELLKRTRLRALGEMAAGVAHDVNNALSPALVLSEVLATDEAISAEHAKLCESVASSVTDAAEIIKRLSPLYRHSDDKHEQVEIAELLSEVVKVSRTLLRQRQPDKSICFEITSIQTKLFCSAPEIRELLTNLLNNAVDAIEHSGTVCITCESENGDVRLTVADDGCGMSEEVQHRCLESFYSTKHESGTGLGLATSRMIVASYDGRIRVESELGKGSTFIVTIPQKSPKSRELMTNREVGSIRILVVDDIDSTRNSVSILLESRNHEVTRAASAEEAINALERAVAENRPFQILLTDHQMEGMTGLELCTEFRRQQPETKLIIMSGNEVTGIREGCDYFLRKPISVEDILLAISSVTTGGS